jgi:hypothetical protein
VDRVDSTRQHDSTAATGEVGTRVLRQNRIARTGQPGLDNQRGHLE